MLDQKTVILSIVNDVGPEIGPIINNGLIINEAKWSGPALQMTKLVLSRAVDSGVQNVFIIDHDKSEAVQKLFNPTNESLFHGYGELISVKNGRLNTCSGKLALDRNIVQKWINDNVLA